MVIPNVELINGIWRGKIQLDSWNEFFNSSTYIELIIGGDQKTEKLEEKHKLAYEYIVKNQDSLLKIILNELMEKYPNMQEEYGYDEDELDEFMPNISDVIEFKNMLTPRRIYILNIENEGISYIGFHFLCAWDEERDFGVMMFKRRIVKMGGADSAFLSWIAEEDKENY